MKKSIIYVLTSFFTVICIILLGVNIIFRTKTIPELESEIYKKENQIRELKVELSSSIEKQQKAEADLKVKLEEEEQIALEKAKAEEDARIVKEKAEAEAARIASEEEVSKKSEAS